MNKYIKQGILMSCGWCIGKQLYNIISYALASTVAGPLLRIAEKALDDDKFRRKNHNICLSLERQVNRLKKMGYEAE